MCADLVDTATKLQKKRSAVRLCLCEDTSLTLTLGRRRKEKPAWQLLLGSRDFGAIMLLNAMMFMTQNGSRAVLVPLLATQAFGVTTTTLGVAPSLLCTPCLA